MFYIKIREATDQDTAFIRDSWRKSAWRSMSEYMARHHYDHWFAGRVTRLLANRDTLWLVAHDPDDEDFIFGWLCESDGVLRYVYTRQRFREADVARRLVRHADLQEPIVCSSWTGAAAAIAKEHPGMLVYDPGER